MKIISQPDRALRFPEFRSKEAIDELEALSENNPFRQRALELLYTLQKSLKSRQELPSEDRELVMRLEPLYQQEREQRDQEIKEFMQKRFAQKLLSKGMEIEQIAELTELSPEEITKLTNNDE